MRTHCKDCVVSLVILVILVVPINGVRNNKNPPSKNNLFSWDRLWEKSYYQILDIKEHAQLSG